MVLLGRDLSRALGVTTSDYLEVRGRRSTVAAVLHQPGVPPPSEGSLEVEPVVMRNAGATVGEVVELRRVELPLAERLTIAPVYDGHPKMDHGAGLEAFVAKALARRSFVEGDALVVRGVFLMGGSLLFLCTDTTPSGAVRVGPNTLVTISRETFPESLLEVEGVPTHQGQPDLPELNGGPKLAKELAGALRAYHLRAQNCGPPARDPALAWWEGSRRVIRDVLRDLDADAKWREANEQWERNHPKPSYTPGSEDAWLARMAAREEWERTHPDPRESLDHMRPRGLALREMQAWALSNPPPTLRGTRFDQEIAARASHALLASARFALEDHVWHENYATWKNEHPDPPLPPKAPASATREWEVARHAWENAHPHPGETPEELRERQRLYADCEALWTRLSDLYP